MPISNHIKPPHSKTYQTKSNQELPSGYVKIAIEKMTIERVDFPIKNGGFSTIEIVDFPDFLIRNGDFP